MIVGRERGLLEALWPTLAVGTRFELRRDLEARFWERIQAHIVEGHWQALLVSDTGESGLSRYQAVALDNPFNGPIASALANKPQATKLVFHVVNSEPASSERKKREEDAINYIRTWAQARGPRIPVPLIEEEIAREFRRYNFGPRAIKRIRIAAGLKQKRGNFSHEV
jgi:hypothetical protein